MRSIDAGKVILAINEQQKEHSYAARATAPAGGHCNNYGLVLYGNAVTWQGFGKVTVMYTTERMNWLRRTIYASMPLAAYMTDADLLYHYFCYLTPTAFLYDASLQISALSNNVLCGSLLN